jgi:protocatechuate 3,4-dioxygenase beta subunit
MNDRILRPTRRLFLGGLALGAASLALPRLFAADPERVRTPAQTEGPFYPTKLPVDTDNDLIIVNDSGTLAGGEITHLSGRILDKDGSPVRNALVEIWQCDHKGIYLHPDAPDQEKRDTHFQGFGRFLTASNGEYYFRTIKPMPYPGRTPHVHFKIKRAGKELLTTQCYVRGEPLNDKDGIYKAIRDAKQREAVTIEFARMKESKAGDLAATFDVILGVVPEG